MDFFLVAIGYRKDHRKGESYKQKIPYPDMFFQVDIHVGVENKPGSLVKVDLMIVE